MDEGLWHPTTSQYHQVVPSSSGSPTGLAPPTKDLHTPAREILTTVFWIEDSVDSRKQLSQGHLGQYTTAPPFLLSRKLKSDETPNSH